jgi:hypothetical protein
MQTGDPKMLLTLHLQTLAQCPFMSQNQFVVIYFFMVAVLFCGKLTKKLGLVDHPVKLRLKLPMNVSRIYKCSAISSQTLV